MNSIIENEIEKEQAVKKVCDFFQIEIPNVESLNMKDAIIEACLARLSKSIGVPRTSLQSNFFNFFSIIMGEAICEKLAINVRIASDELRLIKYDHVNLISEVKDYFDNKIVEDAIWDTFNLVDKFQYIIPQLKKV